MCRRTLLKQKHTSTLINLISQKHFVDKVNLIHHDRANLCLLAQNLKKQKHERLIYMVPLLWRHILQNLYSVIGNDIFWIALFPPINNKFPEQPWTVCYNRVKWMMVSICTVFLKTIGTGWHFKPVWLTCDIDITQQKSHQKHLSVSLLPVHLVII